MANSEEEKLRAMAENYTAAWCSQRAESVAAFYSPNGSLSINGAPPAIGREAIAAAAQSFMTAFPDLNVVMDNLIIKDDETLYQWTLTGTNTGPGGTGNRIQISGHEKWRLNSDAQIAESKGHFDIADYNRQLNQAESEN